MLNKFLKDSGAENAIKSHSILPSETEDFLKSMCSKKGIIYTKEFEAAQLKILREKILDNSTFHCPIGNSIFTPFLSSFMQKTGSYLGPSNRAFAWLLIGILHFFKFEYMLFKILSIKYLYIISDWKHFILTVNTQFLVKNYFKDARFVFGDSWFQENYYLRVWEDLCFFQQKVITWLLKNLG